MSNQDLEREALDYHKGGKISLGMPKRLESVSDLCLAYTPGVAHAVRKIAAEPLAAYDLTAKGGSVAVVSDGTAILGLGDLGPSAAIPVMEGKAALFKTFANVDAWPAVLDNCRMGGAKKGPTDPERVIAAAAAIAPLYGGINLEDIAAPACFEIEDRLSEMLDIPVFHDDQWGTAVIVLAAVENYAALAGAAPAGLRIVINGAGAAGMRIREMLVCGGADAGKIIMCDSRGVIFRNRAGDAPGSMKAAAAAETAARTLEEALRGADVFIGVSKGGCVEGAWIAAMAECPAVFALANPEPEIHPARVAEAMRGRPFVMATGRSDFPNQINNVLCFPFLFRGALDVRARKITPGMKISAARALSAAARRGPDEAARALYPGAPRGFGRDYIIPKPFDKGIFTEVSLAVAKAAVADGVARISDFNPAAYEAHLRVMRAGF